MNILEEIKEMIVKLLEQYDMNKERIYTNKQVMELLGVKDKLIKRYRDEGLIAYSQVGDKYWYRKEDIDAFLSNHYNKAYAQ